MSFHFIVRLTPPPENAAAFREELLRVIERTREEEGCLDIHAFEALRDPIGFAVHSRFVDEAAFDLHVQLPHTLRFIENGEKLLGKPIQGLRARQIG